MKKEKLELIKKLKAIFGESEQIILTGSTVVELQGLTGVSNDIDLILINPTQSAKDTLVRLVNTSPALPGSVKNIERGIYQFVDGGIKVDVFIDSVKYDSLLNYDGITLSPLKDLIVAKQSYHRLKDLLQLKSWAIQFYNPDNLNAELTLCLQRENY